MGKNYAEHVSRKETPQTEAIPGDRGTRQAKNNAGGFSFVLSPWDRLDRFLILGSDGGTYYVDERELTQQNAACVEQCAELDFDRTLARIVEISDSGRAPKNRPAQFALALLASMPAPASTKAFDALPRVCRTGTHLFETIDMLKHLRGRGRSYHRGVQNWYLGKDPKQLAFGVTKYAQREGWSHADLLRLVKPKTDDPHMDGVLAYITGKDWKGKMPDGPARSYLETVEVAKQAESETQIVNLIHDANLPREVIPTQFLNSPAVWEALLNRMPPMAMIRNLGKMGSVGLLTPMSTASGTVKAKLADLDALKKARLHPLSVLVALSIYKNGRGVKGSLHWEPDSGICLALNDAFFDCFQAVEPTGKRHLLAIDGSASMTWDGIAGSFVKPLEAAAALAMLAARTEPETHTCIFSMGGRYSYGGRSSGWSCEGARYGIQAVPDIGAHNSLMSAVNTVSRMGGGGTDCSLPMQYALAHKIPVDAFVVLTDNETYAGKMHPVQALDQYRQKMGIPSKLIVVGMTATQFSIADPKDNSMLDVVGFDTNAPSVMADFVRQ